MVMAAWEESEQLALLLVPEQQVTGFGSLPPERAVVVNYHTNEPGMARTLARTAGVGSRSLGL